MGKLFMCLSCALACTASYSQGSNDPSMFRSNVRHDSYLQTSWDLVYDTKAWKFDAHAPIRATALVVNNGVYFGSAEGIFFSIDKHSGKVNWQYNAGKAIHSSAASQEGKLFFSDNGQTLYCLRQSDGGLLWKTDLGTKRPYPWRFDYYYSSPVLYHDRIYIGSDDGNLYAISIRDGSILWKFKSEGLVRSTPSIFNDRILFGDTEGIFYCIDELGKEVWTYKITGQPLKLDTLGFDRKAMLGAPVIKGNKVVFGARDGYLYCLDPRDGKFIWKVDHEVSWVISTVAIRDSMVVTGTSDGRFIQAVHLETGRQIWKYRTPQATWSSPFINNNRVYEGCYDGQLYCLDLLTGKRISQFATNGMILSSAVINDSLLYVGSDDGYMYALRGRPAFRQSDKSKLVYFDPDVAKIYFRNGADTRIKNYLQGMGFKAIGTDTLATILSGNQQSSVIVFATDYFPESIIKNGGRSLLRRYLDGGGRIILLGNNPLFFEIDAKTRQIVGLADRKVDTVLNLDFGPPDTRAFGGLLPAAANAKGRVYGLPESWVSNFGIDKNQVDLVLGENENGQASAFVKNYQHGGRLIQIYLHTELPVNLDAIVKLAEND